MSLIPRYHEAHADDTSRIAIIFGRPSSKGRRNRPVMRRLPRQTPPYASPSNLMSMAFDRDALEQQ